MSLWALFCFAFLQIVCAQDWYHLPKSVGPTGDFPEDALEMVRKMDVGVDGDASYVKAGDFQKALLQEGDKPMPNTGVNQPEEWAKKAHVEIVDGEVKDVYGTKTVLTNKGLQPAVQYDYWAYWKLDSRPRKMGLLIMDMIEDYRIYVGYLIPKIKPLVGAFREAGMPIFWSNWIRRPDDKTYGALDRFYGPRGVKSFENPMYVYAKEGSSPMKDIAPTDEEIAAGYMIHSNHLSKFADVTDDGKSFFRGLLADHGVDTLVIVGAWSEDCVTATAFDAVDTENLDVVVIEDGIGTATPAHFPALEVMKASAVLMQKSEEVVDYMESHKNDDKYLMRADVTPGRVYSRKVSPAVSVPVVQTVVLTVQQLGLIVLLVMISSVGITLTIQRVIAQKNRKTYMTLAENSVDPLETLEA